MEKTRRSGSWYAGLMTWLAVLLKPLFLVALLALLYPVRALMQRLPDGRMKRVLLFKPVHWRPKHRYVLWLIWLPIVGLMAYGIGLDLGYWLAK